MSIGIMGFGPDSTALAVWFWVMCSIGLVWLRRHFDLNRGRREPVLTEADADRTAAELPPLSVLVAAKDEEANIGRCIAGLLAQDYPHLQVVVVNDRSADRTGEIIDQYAARDARLTPVHVRELPPGWFGKNNAMREGVTHATGEWLCFSDADCTYDSPRLLTAAARFARHADVEFLSVLPRLEAGSLWERIVQPVAGGIMVFWNPPHKVNDPQSPRAYANGAFMLLSRRAYETIGGHEPVKATLNEDMHMARRAKQFDVRLRVIRSQDMYRVRMYTGLPAIWRGWSRIFYGCFGTAPRLIASLLMLAVFSVWPYVTLLSAPFAAGANASWLAGAAGFAVLAQQSVVWRFYRVSGVAAPWALSYPLGALLCLGMILNAMARRASPSWPSNPSCGASTACQGSPRRGH